MISVVNQYLVLGESIPRPKTDLASEIVGFDRKRDLQRVSNQIGEGFPRFLCASQRTFNNDKLARSDTQIWFVLFQKTLRGKSLLLPALIVQLISRTINIALEDVILLAFGLAMPDQVHVRFQFRRLIPGRIVQMAVTDDKSRRYRGFNNNRVVTRRDLRHGAKRL